MFEKVIKLIENAKTEVLAFLNAYTLTITTDNEAFQMPKRAARKRGVRFLYITEITKDNVSYCKKQLNMIDELRHLDSIRGNFIMSDNEFIASHEISPQKPISEGFYSGIDKMLKQERYVFQTIWSNAIPAAEKIKQLEQEDGIRTSNMSAAPKSTATEQKGKRIIDRFYICELCRSVFIYADEVEEHKAATSHKKFAEFPFFESI